MSVTLRKGPLTTALADRLNADRAMRDATLPRLEFGDPHFASRRTLVPAGSDEAHDARARFGAINMLLEGNPWGMHGVGPILSADDEPTLEDFR